MNEAEKFFRELTSWQDADVAVSLASGLAECVGEGGDVDEDAVASIANELVVSKPYLRREKGSPDSSLPTGPTGANIGSGRKCYGPRRLDEGSLRKKYPGLNA